MPSEDWSRKAEVLRWSYEEVLSALKHQDDKLNRNLTAIAFLTAAGVTLYTSIGRKAQLVFDGQPWRVTTFVFVLFLISVALALSFTLSAIGPSNYLRRFVTHRGGAPSLLYYMKIQDDPHWESYINWSPDCLAKMLAMNFHAEARLLSGRVTYKVARSTEAAAFIQTAITFLGILGIFSTRAVAPITRWRMSVVFLSIVMALPLWEFVQMQISGFFSGPSVSRRLYGLASLAVLNATVFMILAAPRDAQWQSLILALATVLFLKLSLVRSGWGWFLVPTLTFIGGPIAWLW